MVTLPCTGAGSSLRISLRLNRVAATTNRAPSPKDGKADWLFRNGKIHTVNAAQPDAEAVVVRGKQIVYVGDMAGAVAWRG
jgi:hypothetical protein